MEKFGILKAVFLRITLSITVHAGGMQTHDEDGRPLSDMQRNLNATLKMAVLTGNQQNVDLALQNGADPNAYDNTVDKVTLMMFSVEKLAIMELPPEPKYQKCMGIIKSLLEAGGDPFLLNSDEENTFHIAQENHITDAVDLILFHIKSHEETQ